MAHLNPHVQVTGVMGDLIQGDGGQFYVQVSLALNAVTILVYIIVWALIRVKCLGKSFIPPFKEVYWNSLQAIPVPGTMKSAGKYSALC
jgi:hypothetical protein